MAEPMPEPARQPYPQGMDEQYRQVVLTRVVLIGAAVLLPGISLDVGHGKWVLKEFGFSEQFRRKQP